MDIQAMTQRGQSILAAGGGYFISAAACCQVMETYSAEDIVGNVRVARNVLDAAKTLATIQRFHGIVEAKLFMPAQRGASTSNFIRQQ